jgi:hypothetical protein
MADFIQRKRCKYVYCRKWFSTMSSVERYCCPECRLMQIRYNDRKAKREKLMQARQAQNDA